MAPERNASAARFIVLDGVDGCGKTTQARLLARWLAEESSREVLHLREPGSTAVGEALRELLLSRGHAIEPDVEALLFAAARRQLLAEVIAPALARGLHVVCERFHASTFSYQGVAGGVGEERVLELLAGWAGTPRPHLVVVLDLAPELARERRGAARDRMEDKGEAFLRDVVRGYRSFVERAPNAVLVDAATDVDSVADAVLEEVRRVL